MPIKAEQSSSDWPDPDKYSVKNMMFKGSNTPASFASVLQQHMEEGFSTTREPAVSGLTARSVGQHNSEGWQSV